MAWLTARDGCRNNFADVTGIRLSFIFVYNPMAPGMRDARQTIHATVREPPLPAHHCVPGRAQCLRHFDMIFAVFQMRQGQQVKAPPPIGFPARQLVKVVFLQLLLQHFLR